MRVCLKALSSDQYIDTPKILFNDEEKGMKENVTTGSIKTLGRGSKVKRGQFRCLGGVQRLKETIGSGHARFKGYAARYEGMKRSAGVEN